jgi:hypothetical protein
VFPDPATCGDSAQAGLEALVATSPMIAIEFEQDESQASRKVTLGGTVTGD